MQATPQMTQSIGVRRRDVSCAEDKIACFLRDTRYSTHKKFQHEK